MAQFIWTTEYDLGIEVIDQQHRRILDCINRVYQTLENDQDTAAVNEVLSDLLDYTFSHLAFEEAMLDDVGYSDLNVHKFTHDAFGKLMRAMQARSKAGENVARELAEFLQQWLLSHILTDDAKYVECVKNRLRARDAHAHPNWLDKAIKLFQ